jgi:hypothetical protein
MGHLMLTKQLFFYLPAEGYVNGYAVF